MLTRGILRSTIPATHRGGIVMRAIGGPSILKDLSNERLALDLEEATRMNVHALAVQVFIGGEHETQSVHNMTRLIDAGYRYGIPVLASPPSARTSSAMPATWDWPPGSAPSSEHTSSRPTTARRGFDRVVAGCQVPVVMAGGKKLPELDALEMAYRAVQEGAAGVDMGRNIFQSHAPAAMIQAIGRVVHENARPQDAFELFQDLAHDSAAA